VFDVGSDGTGKLTSSGSSCSCSSMWSMRACRSLVGGVSLIAPRVPCQYSTTPRAGEFYTDTLCGREGTPWTEEFAYPCHGQWTSLEWLWWVVRGKGGSQVTVTGIWAYEHHCYIREHIRSARITIQTRWLTLCARLLQPPPATGPGNRRAWSSEGRRPSKQRSDGVYKANLY